LALARARSDDAVTGWVAVATTAEVAALFGVVHTLLHHAMVARGLPSWRPADTLRTSPLLWTGATLCAASLSQLVALAASRAGGGGGSGVAVAVAFALVGAAIAWFGVRAVGKLY
jgi:hypothetical protein